MRLFICFCAGHSPSDAVTYHKTGQYTAAPVIIKLTVGRFAPATPRKKGQNKKEKRNKQERIWVKIGSKIYTCYRIGAVTQQV